MHNIININNTANNNNFTENKENNFKGFYDSFSISNSKNIISSKEKIKISKNNNSFMDTINNENIKDKNKEIENSDIGNITLKDIEQ